MPSYIFQELCGEAGILSLVRSVLDLDITVFPNAHFVVEGVSRMKSKVLSIVSQLISIAKMFPFPLKSL